MVCLTVIDGLDRGKKAEVTRLPFSIGRAAGADLLLTDPAISRCHARIFQENNRYVIVDNGSNNGVWVNQERRDRGPLKHGDIFSLGNTRLLFSESAATTVREEIEWAAGSPLDPDLSVMIDAKRMNWLQEVPEKIERDGTAPGYSRQLQAMLRMANAVAHISDMEALSQELLQIVFSETNASRGFMLLVDDQKNLVPAAIKKRDSDDGVLSISRTLINTVVNQKKGILSSDLLQDSRFHAEQSIIMNRIRSCLCVPMLAGDEVVGVIHIDSLSTAGVFTPEDLELLVALGSQAAVCVQKVRLLRRIAEEQGKRDQLSQYFPPAQVDRIMRGELDLALGGKQEEVMVLFADIRDFTRISESMSAVDVMAMLNDFFTVMTDIIFRFEGVVDNFLGDCVLAVFGAPSHEVRDPERVVQTAIAMQQAQFHLNRRFELENRPTFGIGIGIHSGVVSRGNVGAPNFKRYTVIGNTVNVCARLCSLAKAGEILISDSVKTPLPASISLEALPPVMVKNVKNPLTPYRVNFVADFTEDGEQGENS